MASSMRLITRSVVVPFRSSVVSASSRFLIIDSTQIARSYTTTTMPIHDSNDQPWLNIPCPKLSSLSFHMSNSGSGCRSLVLKIPDEGMSIYLERPEIKAKGADPCLIHGKTHSESFLAGIFNLRDDKDDVHSIMKFIADDVITSFGNITQKERSWAYYDMFFDRSFLEKVLCPIIAMVPSIKSFSIRKKERYGFVDISMDMPGNEKMKLTSQGLRVTIDMPEMKQKDVKVFFDYDTLFIEGKKENKGYDSWKEHYITGIRLPKGVYQKNNLIKRKMIETEIFGGVFYATIPCSVEKEELPRIKEQLKLDSISQSKKERIFGRLW